MQNTDFPGTFNFIFPNFFQKRLSWLSNCEGKNIDFCLRVCVRACIRGCLCVCVQNISSSQNHKWKSDSLCTTCHFQYGTQYTMSWAKLWFTLTTCHVLKLILERKKKWCWTNWEGRNQKGRIAGMKATVTATSRLQRWNHDDWVLYRSDLNFCVSGTPPWKSVTWMNSDSIQPFVTCNLMNFVLFHPDMAAVDWVLNIKWRQTLCSFPTTHVSVFFLHTTNHWSAFTPSYPKDPNRGSVLPPQHPMLHILAFSLLHPSYTYHTASIFPVASKLHMLYCQHFLCCVQITHTSICPYRIQVTHASIFPAASKLHMPAFSL